MATRSTRGTLRVRVLNGTAITAITVCYAELTLDVDPTLVDVTVSCNTGTRKFPVRADPSGSVSYPIDLDNVNSVNAIMRPGNIVSFELCKNPLAAVGVRVYEVIVETAIGKKSEQHKAMDVGRITIPFESGDWYPEQVGRAGLPTPFDQEPA
jgi:hypothetical protein